MQTKAVKRAPAPRWRNLLAAMVPSRRHSVAGAALAALMIGIVLNAVALQHGRRIALAPDPSVTASVRPPAPPAPPVVAAVSPPAAPAVVKPPAVAKPPVAAKPTDLAETEPDAPEPPSRPALARPTPAKPAAKAVEAKAEPARPEPRPAEPKRAEAKTAEPKHADAIGDFIKSGVPEKKLLVVKAQGDLVRLGYVVRPTGVPDANTRSALLDFAKSHHLPASPEVTPKVIKALNAAIAEN